MFAHNQFLVLMFFVMELLAAPELRNPLQEVRYVEISEITDYRQFRQDELHYIRLHHCFRNIIELIDSNFLEENLQYATLR